MLQKAPTSARTVPPAKTIMPLVLVLCALCGACSPASRATDRPSVIPTPPVLAMDDADLQRIGVREIVIAYAGAVRAPSDVKRTKKQAEERAKMVATVAQMSGEHFSELVLKYSDHPPLEDGGGPGALLERGGGLLPPEAEKAAFRLAVGEVSRPVSTKQGYVIVMRTQTPIGGPVQIGARHILVAYSGATRASPEVTRTREEARARAQEALTKLRAGEDWSKLWEAYSDEPSRQSGGDLGLFGRGQMVPAFEHSAFELDINQISEVVESPFGFHIIQRTR